MDTGRCDSNVQLSLRQVDEISAVLPETDGWLSEPERQRLQSLQLASRRTQFLAGHWLARQAVAAWLGGDWSDYQLSAPEDAAPSWLGGPASVAWQGCHISLSHSGNWVACALAHHAVGVDVECSQQSRDFAALASWIFPDAELLAFRQLAPELQRQSFYTQWTLKEAWVKQAGTAPVKKAMQAIHFAPGAGKQAALVAQADQLTLALYPAHTAGTRLADPLLSAMRWSEWACTPPH